MSNISNKMKQTLPQLGLILLYWVIGEAIVLVLKWSIPGSIVGMILLTLSLESKLLKLSAVEDASDFLIRNMAFFFVPPGVGLMVNMELIADHWLAITIAVVVSTILVLAVTAFISQIGIKKTSKQIKQ